MASGIVCGLIRKTTTTKSLHTEVKLQLTGWPRHAYGLLTKFVRSRWLDIGQVLFFACLWTETNNKGFIIWHLKKFCLRDTAGSPERPRWLHLALSGSQSQRAISFILPALGASHIIICTYWLPQGEGRMGKYLARGQYVLTESEIFSHPARP